MGLMSVFLLEMFFKPLLIMSQVTIIGLVISIRWNENIYVLLCSKIESFSLNINFWVADTSGGVRLLPTVLNRVYGEVLLRYMHR